MPKIRLYMGECDGYQEACAYDKPDVYYAVPLVIASEISKMKDPVAKGMAIKTHSRLAYVFDQVKISDDEGMVFCYRRAVEQDKAADSATSL